MKTKTKAKKPHPTRLFKTPEELYHAFELYKKDVAEKQSQIWGKTIYIGKNGTPVKEPQKVPLTFEGFKVFCRKEYGEVEQYFINPNRNFDDLISICRAIKEEIRADQITGGMLHFYNPSITARLNNLTDKTETTIKTEQPLFP